MSRLVLPNVMGQESFRQWAGGSPIPSSVISLVMGQLERSNSGAPPLNSIFGYRAPDADLPSFFRPWAALAAESDEERAERLCEELARGQDRTWEGHLFSSAGKDAASLSEKPCALPPGCLPHGLRVLQLGVKFNSLLLPGSIPPTVQFLDLGHAFRHPLPVGTLPSSLIHLQFSSKWNHPLVTGLLPPLLECLIFGYSFDQPLEVGMLPSSLQELRLERKFNQPLTVGALPPSLLVLSLSSCFNHPLPAGVLPSSLISLILHARPSHTLTAGELPPGLISLYLVRSHFGKALPHALSRDILPSSLRQLHIGEGAIVALPPHSLPGGLQFLALPSAVVALGEGVLPDSITALDLSTLFAHSIVDAVLPSSLRCLRLYRSFRRRLPELRLSPEVRVCWQ